VIVTLIGIAVLVAGGFWLFGGVILRAGGAFLALLGALALVLLGNAFGIVILAIGVALWLAGHWHFALRHHAYKSPLAERIFDRLPARFDPTRGWGVPVVVGGDSATEPGDESESPSGAPRST
jgi:hypothetical protein